MSSEKGKKGVTVHPIKLAQLAKVKVVSMAAWMNRVAQAVENC
jgi:hypothetical protein